MEANRVANPTRSNCATDGRRKGHGETQRREGEHHKRSAHANTTESLGGVILLAAFAILRGGDPTWVNGTIGFVMGCRLAHTVSYYLDLKLLRSLAFGLGIVGLIALFVLGLAG